ncbi:MAG: SPOR domain-containing protein [Gammaproteobacteria bacterium]|nr:SPOR domain-containing protein [Gammaproteobacteria bacterium]
MDEVLKQKIVGALVVAAALIVLVPTIFDEPALDESLVKVNVPSKPGDLNIYDFDVIERSQVLEQAKNQITAIREVNIENPSFASGIDQRPITDGTAGIRKAVTQLVDNIKVVAGGQDSTETLAPIQAWTVQLASFIERENALKFRQTLRDEKEKSYVKEWLSPGGWVYRVYAGPMLKKEDATTVLQRLNNAHDIQGMVIRYVPQ